MDTLVLYSGTFHLKFSTVCISGSDTLTRRAIIGNRISRKLKMQFYESLLRQEVSYFDTHKTGEITMKMNMSLGLVSPALTSTPNQVLTQLSTLVAGLVIAFLANWKMTLVSVNPLKVDPI